MTRITGNIETTLTTVVAVMGWTTGIPGMFKTTETAGINFMLTIKF